MAALLLQGDSFPMEHLREAVGQRRFGGMTGEGAAINDGVLTFQLGDDIAGVALMPAPYPWSDLEGPVATAWMWPPERRAISVKPHRTHLLVSLIGGTAGPIHRRLVLTQLTAMAAKAQGVLGIYWPEGTLVHYPKVFIEMAKAIDNPDAPPLHLWVDFRVFRNPDRTSGMFTTGLAKLGVMEVEIPRIAMPPGELREWSVNIACYFLENFDRIKDGDTIGMSARQKIRIRHARSSFGNEGTVMRLEM